jgi:nitrate/nitrite-specific signal transduction histidine kinase
VLSNFYVRHRGGYERGSHHQYLADGTPEVTPMRVDLAELDYWLRENDRRARYEEATLSGLRSLKLVYERDLERAEKHQDIVDQVAEYLGVGTAPVEPGLARLTTDDLADFVSNHDELVRFLEQTDYRRFLLPS